MKITVYKSNKQGDLNAVEIQTGILNWKALTRHRPRGAELRPVYQICTARGNFLCSFEAKMCPFGDRIKAGEFTNVYNSPSPYK